HSWKRYASRHSAVVLCSDTESFHLNHRPRPRLPQPYRQFNSPAGSGILPPPILENSGDYPSPGVVLCLEYCCFLHLSDSSRRGRVVRSFVRKMAHSTFFESRSTMSKTRLLRWLLPMGLLAFYLLGGVADRPGCVTAGGYPGLAF